MNIADKSVVSMHYTLTNDGGEVIDSSEGREPLFYLQGAGNIIPGLEKEMMGKAAGDELKVTVAPEEGYGVRTDELVQTMPHDAFQGVDKIMPGMQFQAQSPEGHVQMIQVIEVVEEGVKVDANHPLAGQTLHFEVKVVEIREASAEELEHGHPHQPGHDHH